MNAFSIVRLVLLIFLIIVLVLMVILFSRAIIGIVRNDVGQKSLRDSAISSALVGANCILGLLGAYREHFLFTLIFAILQTIIVLGKVFFVPGEDWVFIPWVGSAILAYVLAFMIKKGYTQG